MEPGRLPRIASIDILRALTMLLMIFVNDLWSLKDIPGWLEHTAGNTDGMGLADTVFPAFLVIVGMSLPFAVDSRKRKGQSFAEILGHVAARSFALIVMGVFLVNGGALNEAAAGIKTHQWNTLACLAFIMLWNIFPAGADKRLLIAVRAVAWTLLFLMAWHYRGGEESVHGFTTSWWGILGLIGWAYLITAAAFLLAGGRLLPAIIFWFTCLLYNCSFHAGLLPRTGMLASLTAPFAQGAMPAFVAAGAISSLLFLNHAKKGKSLQLIMILLAISTVLIILGFYARMFWGISKIRATPAWVLICSGITIAAFSLIYWTADVRRQGAWAAIIRPAGTNTLLCYLLPYFAYALVSWLNMYLPAAALTGAAGLLKSFLFSLLIVNIAGLLGRGGVRLKL